jgi:hypothetical protein
MTGDLKRHEVFYVGSGAPVTGDEITANNSAYPVGTHYLDSTNGTSYVRTGVSKITGDWTSLGGGTGYLSYVALLAQTGTDDPTATVLKNELGGTVVWTRSRAGLYIGTLAGAFPSGRTILPPFGIISNQIFLGVGLNTTFEYCYTVRPDSPDQILLVFLKSSDYTDAEMSTILGADTPLLVTVHVYPA